jgi:hypothetical protein
VYPAMRHLLEACRLYRWPIVQSNADLYRKENDRAGPGGSWLRNSRNQRRANFAIVRDLNGMLYVNNVFSNNLHRIPVEAAGKPGQPVDI